jgi:hypothetical protein
MTLSGHGFGRSASASPHSALASARSGSLSRTAGRAAASPASGTVSGSWGREGPRAAHGAVNSAVNAAAAPPPLRSGAAPSRPSIPAGGRRDHHKTPAEPAYVSLHRRWAWVGVGDATMGCPSRCGGFWLARLAAFNAAAEAAAAEAAAAEAAAEAAAAEAAAAETAAAEAKAEAASEAEGAGSSTLDDLANAIDWDELFGTPEELAAPAGTAPAASAPAAAAELQATPEQPAAAAALGWAPDKDAAAEWDALFNSDDDVAPPEGFSWGDIEEMFEPVRRARRGRGRARVWAGARRPDCTRPACDLAHRSASDAPPPPPARSRACRRRRPPSCLPRPSRPPRPRATRRLRAPPLRPPLPPCLPCCLLRCPPQRRPLWPPRPPAPPRGPLLPP